MADTVNFFLRPADNDRLANLCGALDGNMRHIARAFGVDINRRGEQFQLVGAGAAQAATLIKKLYAEADRPIDLGDVREYLADFTARDTTLLANDWNGASPWDDKPSPSPRANLARLSSVRLRNESQRAYYEKIRRHAVTFCIGPAGTGKTYVALAAALSLLDDKRRRFNRLLLTRPVVEAVGERLGFLPGNMEQKVNPYLRPMSDILYQFIGASEIERRMAQGLVEFIPLAFMRGLTLNNSILILDEAQNTTPQQMKMLLSRIGDECKIIAMGDIEQSDIERVGKSGIADAIDRLKSVDDIARHIFTGADIVRHPLIHKILKAYEQN